ncbi:MAG: hypothetical protein ACI81R_003054 [Bradymonadia bacterium]
MSETQNQRNHERMPINQEFEKIDQFIAEYVTNISRGGVFIRSRSPLPVGTCVNLYFSVILDDFETIEGEGEVMRVIGEGEGAGMGVRFMELTPRSAEIIEEICRRQEAEAEAGT